MEDIFSNLGGINFFVIMAVFFVLMSLMGFVFFIITKYHFDKFNYEKEKKGNWLVKYYFYFYIFLVLTGLIVILINLLFN